MMCRRCIAAMAARVAVQPAVEGVARRPRRRRYIMVSSSTVSESLFKPRLNSRKLLYF